MIATRTEHDTLGPVEVPELRLWGAQTQRAVVNFRISKERMPDELLRALVRVKQAAARANAELKVLPPELADAIVRAAEEVLSGLHGEEFPLLVWQTGSGTQTNMNVNEVLANRASELLGGPRGEGRRVHPNDHVNKSQSSNDTIPTALNVAVLEALVRQVLPALQGLRDALAWKAQTFADVVKVGRTHLMDATPLTVGQELSGWVAQLDQAVRHIELTLPHLSELAIGGSAVGTGLNTPDGFAPRVVELLSSMLELPFSQAGNRFEAVSASDAVVHTHGALKGLAMSLLKIANDVRLLASGPRTGLGELRLPENEPGSSIMPGKVNPTQCEMLAMVCAQVLGNDVAVSVAGGAGQLQLNTFRPLLAHASLQSCRLLADAMRSFSKHCIEGLEVDHARVQAHLEQSLMLVTALAPHVGYDTAAAIAHRAHKEGLTLKAAAVASGAVTAEQFDLWVQPAKMVGGA